jgi:hypothetical protein
MQVVATPKSTSVKAPGTTVAASKDGTSVKAPGTTVAASKDGTSVKAPGTTVAASKDAVAVTAPGTSVSAAWAGRPVQWLSLVMDCLTAGSKFEVEHPFYLPRLYGHQCYHMHQNEIGQPPPPWMGLIVWQVFTGAAVAISTA